MLLWHAMRFGSREAMSLKLEVRRGALPSLTQFVLVRFPKSIAEPNTIRFNSISRVYASNYN